MSTLTATIQLRADTAANWQVANPTLKVFELGIETDSYTTSGTTRLYKCKLGDGATAWNSLGYANLGQFFAGGGSGGSVSWANVTNTPTTLSGYGITDAPKVLCKSTTDSSPASGTGNTKLIGYLITGGSVDVGDIMETFIQIRKSGDANTSTIRFYFNSVDDLSGAILAGTVLMGATSDSIGIGRFMGIKSSTVTEVYTATATSNTQFSEAALTTAVTNMNIDWTSAKYFIIAAQNANATDTTVVSFALLRKV